MDIKRLRKAVLPKMAQSLAFSGAELMIIVDCYC